MKTTLAVTSVFISLTFRFAADDAEKSDQRGFSQRNPSGVSKMSWRSRLANAGRFQDLREVGAKAAEKIFILAWLKGGRRQTSYPPPPGGRGIARYKLEGGLCSPTENGHTQILLQSKGIRGNPSYPRYQRRIPQAHAARIRFGEAKVHNSRQGFFASFSPCVLAPLRKIDSQSRRHERLHADKE